MNQRNFTDADLEALIDMFWRKIQQEVGGGILKGLWTSLIGFVIGACALGLAIKMKLVVVP
jgi:hypothetical protein